LIPADFGLPSSRKGYSGIVERNFLMKPCAGTRDVYDSKISFPVKAKTSQGGLFLRGGIAHMEGTMLSVDQEAPGLRPGGPVEETARRGLILKIAAARSYIVPAEVILAGQNSPNLQFLHAFMKKTSSPRHCSFTALCVHSFRHMKRLTDIGVARILSRGLLAAGILASMAASASAAITAQDAVDTQISDLPAVSAEVVAPDLADIELDFRTVSIAEDWSLQPGVQHIAWRRSASNPAYDHIPLSLLLVATQATSTDL